MDPLVQWVEQGFEGREQWEPQGEALQLHADRAWIQGDLKRLFTLVHQAQPLLTEHSLIHPHNVVFRDLEASLAGEVQLAWQSFFEGYERLKHLGDHSAALATSLFLSAVFLEKGELHEASRHALPVCG